jgi:hypothetical protein
VSSCAQLRRGNKITRGACACKDDKVIFENALNWTTRSFIFAKQGEYEHGRPTPEPGGDYRASGLTWLSWQNPA